MTLSRIDKEVPAFAGKTEDYSFHIPHSTLHIKSRGVAGWRAPARRGRWQRSAAEGEPSPLYRRKNGSSSLQTKDERKKWRFAQYYYDNLSSLVSRLIPIFSLAKIFNKDLIMAKIAILGFGNLGRGVECAV